MESQYFRSGDLADAIVAAGKANPALVVIIVVVANAGADDGANAVTARGDYLQFTTFDKIVKALGSRARIYTMQKRAVHAKFILVDDAWMCVGSANANVRSFLLDSELNIQTTSAALVSSFRQRLWAFNLGSTEGIVSQWPVSDFLSQWDTAAKANVGVNLNFQLGEGVIPFDYRSAPGKSSWLIPDAFAQNDAIKDLDVSRPPAMIAGEGAAGGGSADDAVNPSDGTQGPTAVA